MSKRKQILARLQVRLEDARQLIEIHATVTGLAPGRRFEVDALIRGAVILSVAAWEAFIEDLALVNARYFSIGLAGPSQLPAAARDPFLCWLHASEDFKNPTPSVRDAMWSLTGRGWRTRYREYAEEKTQNFHTPNANNIRKLFKTLIGLEDITDFWGNGRWQPEVYRRKLDETLLLRHRIAHGAIGHETVGKPRARAAISLVSALGSRSYDAISDHFSSSNVSISRARRRRSS